MIVPFASLFALLFVVPSLAVNQIKGFMEQTFYMTTKTCANDPSAYVTSSWGECVKIFAGPEDPTTELTSYRLNIGESTVPGQIVMEKYLFSDSSCIKANGQQTSVVFVSDCLASDPNSFQFSNVTHSTQLPSSLISGLAVLGYQEYNTCSQNRQVTNRVVYPNDQCYPSEGKTKRGDKYLSYSIYCASNVVTLSYFSDAACQASISSTTNKLGGGDTTCTTNQGDYLDSDVNLFLTYTCSGNAVARPTPQQQGEKGVNLPAYLGQVIHSHDLFSKKL